MNAVEYLLTQLSEECGEVAKEASKANRFGLDDVYPLKPELGSNRERIINELNDLQAVIEILQQRRVLPKKILCPVKIASKKRKIRVYMRYARYKGTLK